MASNGIERRRWTIDIESIELRFVELPLKSPFQTSFGTMTNKSAWIIAVSSEGITGWSETVADTHPFYNEETHASVYFAMKNDLIPRLMQHSLSHPREVQQVFEPIRGNRMAKAALEMAIWDWFAQSHKMPLWRFLGGEPSKSEISVGVSIGVQPTIAHLLDIAEKWWAQGYRRLKIKIKPGRDVEDIRALRNHLGEAVPLMVDANSAYTLSDQAMLQQLDEFGLMMMEQPLSEDDIVDHRILRQVITTPICLDESIRSINDARRAFDLGSLDIINMKVGRVGGYQSLLDIHQFALDHHIPLWCGGMLETGIGRAHNLHLSTLKGFVLPGDTSASDRYFDEDIISTPFSLNNNGTLTVPQGMGIGVEPDVRVFQLRTTYKERVTRDHFVTRGYPFAGGTSF